MFELREHIEEGNSATIEEIAVFPVIPITCRNCGNTALVNPISAGLIEKDEKQDVEVES